MIRFIAPSLSIDGAREDSKDSRGIQRKIDFLEGYKTTALPPRPSIVFHHPVNIDTDQEYEFIEFVITERFQQHGVTWLVGGRFEVSLDSFIEALEDVRDRMRVEEEAARDQLLSKYNKRTQTP